VTAIVNGYYRDGKLELLETPHGLRAGRVRVVLTEETDAKVEPRYLQFGKYIGPLDTTLDDFKQSEWHGEAEFDELTKE